MNVSAKGHDPTFLRISSPFDAAIKHLTVQGNSGEGFFAAFYQPDDLRAPFYIFLVCASEVSQRSPSHTVYGDPVGTFIEFDETGGQKGHRRQNTDARIANSLCRCQYFNECLSMPASQKLKRLDASTARIVKKKKFRQKSQTAESHIRYKRDDVGPYIVIRTARSCGNHLAKN